MNYTELLKKNAGINGWVFRDIIKLTKKIIHISDIPT